MVAFASSFDQGGVIAKSAEDCALVLSAMAGFDDRDSTSLQEPAEDFTRLLSTPLTGRTIGVPREFFGDGLNNDVAARAQEAISQFESLGARVVDVSLPASRHAIPAYYVLTCAEASSNLSRYDGVRYGFRANTGNSEDGGGSLRDMYEQTRAQGFGGEVKMRILIGAYVLSYGYYDAYYRRAMKVRKLVADDFARAFKQCDFIMGPTTPNTAFAVGAIADPVSMYMPVGLQLIGAPLTEAALLAAAHQYQQHSDHHLQVPAV